MTLAGIRRVAVISPPRPGGAAADGPADAASGPVLVMLPLADRILGCRAVEPIRTYADLLARPPRRVPLHCARCSATLDAFDFCRAGGRARRRSPSSSASAGGRGRGPSRRPWVARRSRRWSGG